VTGVWTGDCGVCTGDCGVWTGDCGVLTKTAKGVVCN
jgi:hypothetical protein